MYILKFRILSQTNIYFTRTLPDPLPSLQEYHDEQTRTRIWSAIVVARTLAIQLPADLPPFPLYFQHTEQSNDRST
jgi:hypothetical protein